MYQLLPTTPMGAATCIKRIADNAFIPFCPDNTDYQQFLRDVEAGAELLDAEGNLVDTEQKQTFLNSLI